MLKMFKEKTEDKKTAPRKIANPNQIFLGKYNFFKFLFRTQS